jgi:hypothetical protein
MGFLSDRCQPVACNTDGLLVDGAIAVVRIARQGALEITGLQSQELGLCYIDPEILEQMANANALAKSDQLAAILPDAPHIRSGDFGEILSREFLRQSDGTAKFPVFRWRNRSTKNDTVRGTDLIGYAIVNAQAVSEHDILILCEVKTRAATVKDDIVLDALDDVKKDYASRMANSVHFYQARLLQDNLPEEAKIIGRFINPHNAPYKKKLLAVVVHAEHLWKDAFLQVLPNTHGLKAEVTVQIIRVEELAVWINEVYVAAIASVNQDA